MIAVDKATVENGCMQVIKGSHHMGRVNHVLSGDQAGADMERVEEAKKRLDLVHVTMDPGMLFSFIPTYCILLQPMNPIIHGGR